MGRASGLFSLCVAMAGAVLLLLSAATDARATTVNVVGLLNGNNPLAVPSDTGFSGVIKGTQNVSHDQYWAFTVDGPAKGAASATNISGLLSPAANLSNITVALYSTTTTISGIGTPNVPLTLVASAIVPLNDFFSLTIFNGLQAGVQYLLQISAGTTSIGEYHVDMTLASVPLPETLSLFCLGLALLGFLGWHRKRAAA